MTTTLWPLLDLALRSLHVAAAIAWIGASFYFNWLERRLNVPPRDPENANVAGDLWALHSGAFYHSQKYTSSGHPVPHPLYRFRWPAYTTFLSGIALMYLVYYSGANLYLVNPDGRIPGNGTAIAVSIGLIVATWCVYHVITERFSNDRFLAIIGSAVLVATSAGVCELFIGRGAFLQMGAMLGTTMVANVFFVIMPAQREILAALAQGQQPDGLWNQRASRRSIHNNYLTIPVLICMLSPHYPLIYGQPHNWLVLSGLMLAGALVRYAVNVYHAGRRPWAPAIAFAIVTAALGASIVRSTETHAAITFDPNDVRSIVDRRCGTCHAAVASFPDTFGPAAGLSFETDDNLIRWAGRIHERTVISRTMPPNNVTGMTNEERLQLDLWFVSLSQTD